MATGPEFVGGPPSSFVTYSLGNCRGSGRRQSLCQNLSQIANLQTSRWVGSPQSLTLIVGTYAQKETKKPLKKPRKTRPQDNMLFSRKTNLIHIQKYPSASLDLDIYIFNVKSVPSRQRLTSNNKKGHVA
jgi:hypothetical protein